LPDYPYFTVIPSLDRSKIQNLQCALEYVPRPYLILADAVRINTNPRHLKRISETLCDHDVVVSGIPSSETIYVCGPPANRLMDAGYGYVESVPDRRGCYVGQTPEGWNTEVLRWCCDAALRYSCLADTGFSMAYTAMFMGIANPVMVLGDPENVKVNFPWDFELIKMINGGKEYGG